MHWLSLSGRPSFEREESNVVGTISMLYEGWSHELYIDTSEHQPITARDVLDRVLEKVSLAAWSEK